MSIVNAFANFTYPGVRVVETTAGYRPLELASFQAVYMFGSAANGPIGEPTLVRTLADFTNQFPGSLSEASVKLFFRNDRQGVLYFTRVGIAKQFLISIDASTAGAYTVAVNGTNITATAVAGDTRTTIATKLLNEINTSLVSGAVTALSTADPEDVLVRADNLSNLTITAVTSNLTVSNTTPTTPAAADYVYAFENTFDYEEDWAQGFLIAPEAFQNFALQSDRLIVANAMEQLASNEDFDWFAITDCGATIDTVAEYQAESALYTTPQGHLAYYAPYLLDLEGLAVPASAAVAGIATRRYREEGFHQPAAGAKYPVLGVQDVTVRLNRQDQSVLNPIGCNLVRNLRNKGVVVWAMRTRSADAFYRFTVTRIIMNVLNGTLRRGFDFDLFNSIDGNGVLLSRIEETARAVCRQLWRGKALFGNSESDAFEVVCNFTNNTPEQLEQGNVLVEVYAAPSPAVEKILVNTVRVAIGQVQAAAAAGQQ